MTIERPAKPARPAARLDLSGPEWKLYIAAALGIAYTASFLAMDGPEEKTTENALEAVPSPSPREPPRSKVATPAPRARFRLRTRSS